jgi:ABC-type Zn uptake system ZnuABC Zn-binding protein ZnuA
MQTASSSLLRSTVAAAATALALVVAGCGSDTSRSSETETKTVLTTFTVLADMAQNVAGDAASVESLTKLGAEIHGYEPTPSDIVRAQDADLILDNGLGLERWFEKFYGGLDGVPRATLTEGVTPIPVAEGAYEGKPNPHAWMSPENAVIYVENIRKALVELDPANRETFDANAAAYTAKIEAIGTYLKTSLSTVPEKRRTFTSCEGAFTYLIRDYDLNELYMWPINSDQYGTPQQIAKVVDGVREGGVPTVFCESTVNPDAMKRVAAETGARFGGHMYVDSLTAADGDAPTYLDLLRYDARKLVAGLTDAQ